MNRQRRFILAILLALVIRSHGVARSVKIGAIFHKGDEDYISTFHRAIAETKHKHVAHALELVPVFEIVDADTDSFKTAASVCKLLEQGVAAIFGPASPHTRGIVASIAARYDVPHIDYVWRESEKLSTDDTSKSSSSMTINVFPDNERLSEAIANVVNSTGWESFIAIYENDDGLSRIQKTLTLKNKQGHSMIQTVRQLHGYNTGKGLDYRPMLKEIKLFPVPNIIIDVEPRNLIDVLNQSKEVKLLTDYCNVVITYLDASKLPILELLNGNAANITGLSLRKNENAEGIDWLNSAILYDAVFLLDEALSTLNAITLDDKDPLVIEPTPLSCNDANKYQAGRNITSVIRELSTMGKITGQMSIDEHGRRRKFNIRVLNFRKFSVVETGVWNSSGLHLKQSEQEIESYVAQSIQDKVFRVTTKLGEPYVMEVTGGGTRGVLIDQKYYEGYCIDLIKKIAKHLNFKYQFELVPDGQYGAYDPQKKSWSGLIGRLLDRKADLAICDLTITYQRESAVDFSMPFMNLGISILFSKAEDKVPKLFSFLEPLSANVWIYMATAYLAVSIMLFFQARMAPGEWDNPHPCNADPEELENNFSLRNSMWLTIGSLMQQGSDILPKAPSIRMLTSMWWFFTLIMISSYTANLAAFLTVDKMDIPIKGVEDLAKQTKISYGCVEKGSTANFFRDSNYSTYKRMWSTMAESKPSVFEQENDKAVERVIKSKRTYAFLMESTTIEYKMERNCDLEKIGGLIDNKGYGIALPRNSPFRTQISGAILALNEDGTLQELKNRWWKTNGGRLCKKDDTEKSTSTNELGLSNVGGVFLVLLCGCGVSLIIAICEFLWNIRKVAVKEKITPREALVAELKFAVNIRATTKPVKIGKTNSSVSSVESGLGRGSTARSIVGSFLRLDMLDKFDKDRDANNRSNDRKIN